MHLFVNCSFTCVVWTQVIYTLKLSRGWRGAFVSECFGNWKKLNYSFPLLPALLSWNISNEINIAIFEVGSPSIQKIVYKTIAVANTFGNQVKSPSSRISQVILLTGIVIAWFDGDAQKSGRISEARGKILINIHTSY